MKGFKKDTNAGYSIPLTIECAKQIAHARFGPIGVAQHAGIDEKGDIIVKDRLAHDQSFSMGFAPAINDLVDEADQIDLVFGWCLEQIVHQIVALRLAKPKARILICEFDWGSAYRRINGDGIMAASSLTVDASRKFAHMLFQLSFGGKTHPALFSTLSEIACDLCNNVANTDDWSPEACRSNLQKMMGPPIRLPELIPIAQARTLAFDVESRPLGYHDVYLDDMCHPAGN